jgi:hypothetical protein
MNQSFFFNLLRATTLLVIGGFTNQVLAHSAGATIDPTATNASATDLAQVICYDDGNGAPHHLLTEIQDLSPPVPGLFVSVQIMKDDKMTNGTDSVSGDASTSPATILVGGAGGYFISVSKTGAGAREFNITYHCQTEQDVHTGTDISVFQVQ